MQIYLERIYDPPAHKGYRVLADRLWPRGLAKADAHIDEWCKDIAPSPDLRKWFAHDPDKWGEFQTAYKAELRTDPAAAKALLERTGNKPLILLTATKNMDATHIIPLKAFLQKLA